MQEREVDEIFMRAVAVPGFAAKLHALGGGKKQKRVVFENVAQPAHAFLASLLARELPKSVRHLWLVCETPRLQERFYSELSDWYPQAFLLPDVEVAAVEGAVPDPEVSAERLAALQRLEEATDRQVVVLNQNTLAANVPAPGALHKVKLVLERGARADRDDVVKRLVTAGYESVAQVTERGQFSVRGGILDVYSWQHALPVRLEWFDDEVESIREFDLDQQVSVRTLERCALLLGEPDGAFCPLSKYVGKHDLTIKIGGEPDESRVLITASVIGDGAEDHSEAFYDSPISGARQSMNSPGQREAADRQVRAQFLNWVGEGYDIHVIYHKEAELDSLRKTAADWSLDKERLSFRPGAVAGGFVFPAARLAVVTAGEMLGYQQQASAQVRVGSARTRGACESALPDRFHRTFPQ